MKSAFACDDARRRAVTQISSASGNKAIAAFGSFACELFTGAHVDESYWYQADCSARTCFASAADGTHGWLRAILPRRKQAVWRRMHSEQLAVLQPYRLSYQRQEQGRPVRCWRHLLLQSTKPKFHGWAFLLRARQSMRRQRRKTERAMCPLSEDRWSRTCVYDLLPLKKCARRT